MNQNRTQALREKKELELEINRLISEYETQWHSHFFDVKLLKLQTLVNRNRSFIALLTWIDRQSRYYGRKLEDPSGDDLRRESFLARQ